MINSRLNLYFSFIFSLSATFGSLYFSEILRYPPCVLCWYQRICMYPLVLIFGAAIWTEDSQFLKYTLPLSFLGLGIAIYHNLLYYGIIPDSITPCTQGISCTSKQVEYLGFITIPLLSLMSFIGLVVLGFLILRNREKKI
ncbi:MAG: disulfide bond formation protein B [Pseudobdellovibrionaceae bacterium]